MIEQKTKTNKVMTFILAALTVVIAVGIYATLERVDKYLEFKARADCAAMSKFQITIPTDNTVVSYPVEDVYRQCLDEKGY